jgi:hypothetical protein
MVGLTTTCPVSPDSTDDLKFNEVLIINRRETEAEKFKREN